MQMAVESRHVQVHEDVGRGRGAVPIRQGSFVAMWRDIFVSELLGDGLGCQGRFVPAVQPASRPRLFATQIGRNTGGGEGKLVNTQILM